MKQYINSLLAVIAFSVVAAPADEGAGWERIGLYQRFDPIGGPAKAEWIDAGPELGPDTMGRVFYVRKTFVTQNPGAFSRCYVSADCRFKLWLNGLPAARGPARFDPLHQQYDTLDLSSLVHPGTNVVAAEVIYWRADGSSAGSPYFLLGARPAFIFESQEVCSDQSWKMLISPGQAAAPAECTRWVSCGNWFERVDARLLPVGWQEPGFDDRAWPGARPIFALERRGECMVESPWKLVPRRIPPPEERPAEPAKIVQAGVLPSPKAHPPFGLEVAPLADAPQLPVVIPADGQVHYLVFYAGREVTAFPRLEVEGAEGAEIEIAYAEAPSLNGKKGRRDKLEEKRVEGYNDIYITRAGRQVYEPFWHRTFSFVRVAVKASAPLTIHGLSYRWTSYPFSERGAFECSDDTLNRIWLTGRYTARLCAHETYEDCPYYEQLQYVGDTRIQAMVTYYAFGDARLVANALRQIDASRIPEGLTQSRWPARPFQVIPGFSLLWVLMLDDYYLHTGDLATVKECSRGVYSVLRYFEDYTTERGFVANVPYWNFHDWTFEKRGIPDASSENCALTTLLYKGALDAGARLFTALGDPAEAVSFAARARATARALNQYAWSEKEGLYTDGIATKTLSRHVNIDAVLFDVADARQKQRILQRLFNDPALRDTTFYFAYYLHQAAAKLGQSQRIITDMVRWKSMLDLGASTWWEVPGETRSDCHAWSAAPTCVLMQEVLGVRPIEPGYQRVQIKPFPGGLSWAKGTVPTPHGDIQVSWTQGKQFELELTLPDGIKADVILPGKSKQTVGPGHAVFVK